MRRSRRASIMGSVFGSALGWTFVSMLLIAIAGGPASAQEGGGQSELSGGSRIGVGAETVLTAPFAPSLVLPTTPGGAAAVVFDAGAFRIDALLFLLFVEDAATTFAIGGRFFYVIHHGRNSDFSLGGGLALGFFDPDRGDSSVRVALEGAAQLRAFLTPNVALTATLGLGFSFGDPPFVLGLGGQLTGAFGIVYFF